jgi:hypothetical protein
MRLPVSTSETGVRHPSRIGGKHCVRVRRHSAGQALLLHDVDTLLVRVPGTECAIPAIGTWRGDARSEAGRRIAAAARKLAPLGISEMDLRVLMISRLSDRS